jgi:hypothetical protein
MPVKTTQRGVKERSARKIRRENVILRLNAQLKSGTKNGKELHAKEPNGFHFVPAVFKLEEQDVKRIKKELEVLRNRV